MKVWIHDSKHVIAAHAGPMEETEKMFEDSAFTLVSLPDVDSWEEASRALRLPVIHGGKCGITCGLSLIERPAHISLQTEAKLVTCRTCGAVERLGDDALTARSNLTVFTAFHSSCK